MSGFDMSEMQEMQKALQDKYKDKWEPICPEIGQNKLLWMIGEIHLSAGWDHGTGEKDPPEQCPSQAE